MQNPTSSYIRQRVTAIILLPLMFWFTLCVLHILKYGNYIINDQYYNFKIFIASPINLIAAIMFFGAFAIHGIIGIKTIIDDYVQCICIKKILLLSLYILVIVSTIAGIISVLYAHIFAYM